MEVNVIRPFVTGGLETFYKLGNPEMIQESERQEYRRPQAADRGPRVSFSSSPYSLLIGMNIKIMSTIQILLLV